MYKSDRGGSRTEKVRKEEAEEAEKEKKGEEGRVEGYKRSWRVRDRCKVEILSRGHPLRLSSEVGCVIFQHAPVQ